MDNEAQRDVINNTWAITRISTFATVVGTTYYAYPLDVIVPIRVTANNITLPETTLIKLDGDYLNSNWQLIRGKPQSYFIDKAQANSFGIFPWPDNAASTQTIRMHYYAQASTMSATTDVPYNNLVYLYPYHDLIVFYVCYRIFLIEGEPDKAASYRTEYESRLKVMLDAIGKRPNYIPGITGGTR